MTDDWGDPDPDRTWRPGVSGGGVAAAPPRPADEWSYFPPPGQYPAPWEPPPRVPLRVLLKPHAVTFGTTAAVLTLLGAPLALLWRAVADAPVVLRTASGPQPAAPESDQVFAVDGWFVVVSLLAGVLVGTVAWFVLRHRGPAGPLGLTVGGLSAAGVAAAVGRRLVVDRYLYDFCHGPDIRCILYDGTLRLHSIAAVVVLPVALLTAFVVLTLVVDRKRDRDDVPEPVHPY